MAVEYLWGFGALSIGDGDQEIIEFPYAMTHVWFEQENIENETLDGRTYRHEQGFRGYIETTIYNTVAGDGEKLSQLMSLLSNNTYLRVYPNYDAAQDNNLLMAVMLSSTVDAQHLATNKAGQSMTLQFREYERRTAMPTTLHRPACETFHILTGEDTDSTLLSDAGDEILTQ